MIDEEYPPVGTLLRDARQNRVGEYMARQGGRYLLRPVGGGLEWEADDVEIVPALEALSVKVAAANRRSKEGQ